MVVFLETFRLDELYSHLHYVFSLVNWHESRLSNSSETRPNAIHVCAQDCLKKHDQELLRFTNTSACGLCATLFLTLKLVTNAVESQKLQMPSFTIVKRQQAYQVANKVAPYT